MKPEDLKPGMWIRRKEEDRTFDPDVIMRCDSIKWNGNYKKENYINMWRFWDYMREEFFFKDAYTDDLIDDLGVSSEQVTWDEVMATYYIIPTNKLSKELSEMSQMSIEDIVMEIFK